MASVELSAGWQSDSYGLMRQIADQYGIRDHGATGELLQQALQDAGFATGFVTTWDEICAHLAAGDAVLLLVNNALLRPSEYPNAPGWYALHWIRLVELRDDDTQAFCYDPLCYEPQPDGTIYEGPGVYTTDSLRAAIQQTPLSYAGVFAHKDGVDLNHPAA